MKNIKEITLSIFAIIGFVAIITAFTNPSEQTNQQIYSTPESHVWSFHMGMGRDGGGIAFALNKKTG